MATSVDLLAHRGGAVGRVSPWVWWEAVARLERIKQIANRPYPGSRRYSNQRDLWDQSCWCYLVACGVRR